MPNVTICLFGSASLKATRTFILPETFTLAVSLPAVPLPASKFPPSINHLSTVFPLSGLAVNSTTLPSETSFPLKIAEPPATAALRRLSPALPSMPKRTMCLPASTSLKETRTLILFKIRTFAVSLPAVPLPASKLPPSINHVSAHFPLSG